MKAALVIMAAGMGSRYGGSKQVDGIGPNGEILMEYSIFDALRAGFTKVVFIIKPDMRDLMENMVGKHLAARKTADGDNVEVCYAYQDFSSVPDFYKVPSDRVKPFGTVHALLCAREFVHARAVRRYQRRRLLRRGRVQDDLRRAFKARRKRRGYDGRL